MGNPGSSTESNTSNAYKLQLWITFESNSPSVKCLSSKVSLGQMSWTNLIISLTLSQEGITEESSEGAY